MASITNDPLRYVEKLDGTNFVNWKHRMGMLLEEKDLWEVVIGEETLPSTASPQDQEKFNKKQRKALIMITLSINDKELSHVRSCKTATEAWNKLVAVHEAKGIANRLFLRDQLRHAKMEEGEKMLDYITRVRNLVEKLDAVGMPIKDDEVVLTLLGGLPKSYTPLVVALESCSNLLLEDCCTRLLHEELRRHSRNEVGDGEAAFFGKQGRCKEGNRGGNNGRPQESNTRGASSASQPRLCFYCGKPGHMKKDCRKRLYDLKANKSKGEQASTAFEESIFMANDGKIKDSWFVDSGASSHVTNRREWFNTMENIPPRDIIVGND